MSRIIAPVYDPTTGLYDPPPPYVVTIPAAGQKWLSSNDRLRWQPKARIVRGWRQTAGWAARQAKLPALGPSYVIGELVMIGLRASRIDPNNYGDTAKPCIDAIVDVGVWPDDSSQWVTGPDMRLAFARAKTREVEALRLLIWGTPCCADAADCHHGSGARR